jgi:filamentous hemagglutinin family protein
MPSTRLHLLAATGLLAPSLAWAQAPDGVRLSAGGATITQSAARTQIVQSTDRAVIEWRRFDVGPSHHVDIRQPGAGSWSLQRVTGGDPSSIAGRVTSNGGVAIVNPAGIVFQSGAQVDVANLIATTADTANNAFMAGRMAFDGAPRPAARIENRGTITVREGGLAALVAPGVANTGTIRARLGRVALAGGEAFTLDLAGDGLIALDVTRQVAATQGGAALVTNAGVIEAERGHVALTARAASGIIETLVEAGGRIAAPGGIIEVTAPGGGVRIPSGALLDTSGAATGGRVTVGAGAASRIGTPERLSDRTTVERGATLRTGRGGTAVVHAERRTAMHGIVEAPGGAIEVSSRGALALDGAMHAPGGTVLVDPVELRVVDALSGSAEPAEITAAAVNATTGALTLQAERRIRVATAVDKAIGPLTLETTDALAAPGDGIRIERPLAVTGDLVLRSAGDITQASSGARISAGTLFAESRGGAVRLEAGGNAIRALAGGGAATRFDLATGTALAVDGAVTAPEMRLTTTQRLSLRAPLSASGTIELVGLRGIAQVASGAGVAAGTLMLESPLGAIMLGGGGNRVVSLGDVAAPMGLTLANEIALNVAGTLNGGGVTVSVASGDLTQDPAASRILADDLAAFAPMGSVLIDGGLNVIRRLRGGARDAFVLDAGGALTLSGPLAAAEVELRAPGGLSQDQGATLAAGLLRVSAPGGPVLLDDPGNMVMALGAVGAGGEFTLSTTGALRLEGALVAPSAALAADDIAQGSGGSIATPLLRVTARNGDVALDGPGNSVVELGPAGAAGRFALTAMGVLSVTGPLDAGGALLLEAEALRVAAPVSAGALTLRARGGDAVQQGGAIATPGLRAEALGEVRLEAAGNAIAAVAGRARGAFRVATAGALRAGDLAAPEIALRAGGDMTQDAAGIATPLLSVRSGGHVDLRAGANAITALGEITAPGGVTLATSTSLLLTQPAVVPRAVLSAAGDLDQLPGAPLSAGVVRLSAGGAIRLEDPANALPLVGGATAPVGIRLVTGGAMRLEGPLSTGGTLALSAEGDLIQAATGASLTAAVLEARSRAGNVALEGAGNRFGALGTGAAAGRFVIAEDGTAPLRLIGLVAAPELWLAPAGGLLGEGGSLRAGSLRLASGGEVRLEAGGHHIGAIEGRAAGLALANEVALDVTGQLDVSGRLALSAESISLLAPVTATRGALLVALSGDVAQAASGAGLRVAGGLEVYAAGAIAFDGAGNAVPILRGGSAGRAFALATEGPMDLRAAAVSGETVALRATGTMTLDGATFAAGRAVLLVVPGGLSAGARSHVGPLDAGRSPVLVIDARGAGLQAVPDFVQADRAGLAPADQPTQLAAFGPPGTASAGGVAFDVAAGLSPVFLLLDGGVAVGTVQAGRLGLLGDGGSAFLVGTVGGLGGEGAAALTTVSSSSAGYLLNGCRMGPAGCAGPPPALPPAPAPPAILPPSAPPAHAPPPARSILAPLPPQREPEPPAPLFPWPVAWPLPSLVERE